MQLSKAKGDILYSLPHKSNRKSCDALESALIPSVDATIAKESGGIPGDDGFKVSCWKKDGTSCPDTYPEDTLPQDRKKLSFEIAREEHNGKRHGSSKEGTVREEKGKGQGTEKEMKWGEVNKEKNSARMRKWRKDNKERYLARTRKWAKANREKIREYNRKRRQQKRVETDRHGLDDGMPIEETTSTRPCRPRTRGNKILPTPIEPVAQPASPRLPTIHARPPVRPLGSITFSLKVAKRSFPQTSIEFELIPQEYQFLMAEKGCSSCPSQAGVVLAGKYPPTPMHRGNQGPCLCELCHQLMFLRHCGHLWQQHGAPKKAIAPPTYNIVEECVL
ncbi:Aste57867_25379 [Aphanomyces stellatus]|uniref:Aste57867_25379 protein n=1 Tax=Aphanomyces stellatus TaxID=120398 RepID=A0A485LTY4_9STRA|nr:hypothetical protein As57867_025300 [Aphanomyces stellatus]VFU02004.1 Aste57867_25379 [Aphanomyces stellatus]